MPLYEYRCGQCANQFERYARAFHDRPDCPTCGGSEVTRLLSTFAVSTGATAARAGGAASAGACGEGPPCGASNCGRLAN